jgi:hypothetical protein
MDLLVGALRNVMEHDNRHGDDEYDDDVEMREEQQTQ